MRLVSPFERELIDSGIRLIKYFFDVSQEEQHRRFMTRIEDPRKHWKLSPINVESWRRWWDYTDAYNEMMLACDTEYAPWKVVRADDKRRVRLNCIFHLLSQIPYKAIPFEAPYMPKPKKETRGRARQAHVPAHRAREVLVDGGLATIRQPSVNGVTP